MIVAVKNKFMPTASNSQQTHKHMTVQIIHLDMYKFKSTQTTHHNLTFRLWFPSKRFSRLSLNLLDKFLAGQKKRKINSHVYFSSGYFAVCIHCWVKSLAKLGPHSSSTAWVVKTPTKFKHNLKERNDSGCCGYVWAEASFRKRRFCNNNPGRVTGVGTQKKSTKILIST